MDAAGLSSLSKCTAAKVCGAPFDDLLSTISFLSWLSDYGLSEFEKKIAIKMVRQGK